MLDKSNSSEDKTSPIMQYSLAYGSSNGTTGYFSCLPAKELSLEEALKLLSHHPLDTFLHKYALEKLDQTDFSQVMTGIHDAHARQILQILIEEYLRIKPESDKTINKTVFEESENINFKNYTPMPILSQARDKTIFKNRWSITFKDNLLKASKISRESFLRELPYPKDEIEECHSQMQKNRGILREEYERLKAASPEKEKIEDTAFAWQAVEQELKKAGLAIFPEMRHEASLSPIALLRQWPVHAGVLSNDFSYAINGISTAFGRGLTLAQARTSLGMEIVERASAFAMIEEEKGKLKVKNLQNPVYLKKDSITNLGLENCCLPCPEWLAKKYAEQDFYWFPAEDTQKRKIFAPAQAVFLFCNLEEASIFETGGSTGLGAGVTDSQARLAGLLEIIERDACATTPLSIEHFFRIASKDSLIQSLLDDYRARRIYPLFQDITTELGVPAFRCIIISPDNAMIMASSAALSGKKAVLSALTETPWPYSWARPAPFGSPSLLPSKQLPIRFLEDLPDYDLGAPNINLKLLENMLSRTGTFPVYCGIGKNVPNFPVYRVFLPGYESHNELDAINPPALRLATRWYKQFSSI